MAIRVKAPTSKKISPARNTKSKNINTDKKINEAIN